MKFLCHFASTGSNCKVHLHPDIWLLSRYARLVVQIHAYWRSNVKFANLDDILIGVDFVFFFAGLSGSEEARTPRPEAERKSGGQMDLDPVSEVARANSAERDARR
jgi:hypothetical protein